MSNLPELSPTQEDVTSLEKPFSEVDDVSSFCPKISTSFVLSMDNKGQSLGRPGGALGKHFAEVDRNFRYVAPNIDPGFSYFQVEALLDQAADLPERCLADRQLYDGYAVAAFSLGLELQEFCKLS